MSMGAVGQQEKALPFIHSTLSERSTLRSTLSERSRKRIGSTVFCSCSILDPGLSDFQFVGVLLWSVREYPDIRRPRDVTYSPLLTMQIYEVGINMCVWSLVVTQIGE